MSVFNPACSTLNWCSRFLKTRLYSTGFTASPSNFYAIDKPSFIDHIYNTAVTFNDTSSKLFDNNASFNILLDFPPAFPVFQEHAGPYADFEYGRWDRYGTAFQSWYGSFSGGGRAVIGTQEKYRQEWVGFVNWLSWGRRGGCFQKRPYSEGM